MLLLVLLLLLVPRMEAVGVKYKKNNEPVMFQCQSLLMLPLGRRLMDRRHLLDSISGTQAHLDSPRETGTVKHQRTDASEEGSDWEGKHACMTLSRRKG